MAVNDITQELKPALPDDYVGRKFGRLTVLSVFKLKNGHWRAGCLCECGAQTTPRLEKLRTGRSKSCGCYRVELNTSHGFTPKTGHARIYQVWNSMVGRCTRPRDSNYPRYGAKGIQVCDRWRKFENFYADMGDIPKGGSIDRIDPAGNYEPANCRWATRIQQMNNKTTNRLITVGVRTMTLAEWGRETGIKQATIAARIRGGWKAEDAVRYKTGEGRPGYLADSRGKWSRKPR